MYQVLKSSRAHCWGYLRGGSSIIWHSRLCLDRGMAQKKRGPRRFRCGSLWQGRLLTLRLIDLLHTSDSSAHLSKPLYDASILSSLGPLFMSSVRRPLAGGVRITSSWLHGNPPRTSFFSRITHSKPLLNLAPCPFYPNRVTDLNFSPPPSLSAELLPVTHRHPPSLPPSLLMR